MDIYLTDLETGDMMRFPMLPEEIGVQTGPIFQNYTIMAIGQVSLPYGEELTGFSWRGMLPGRVRENEPYVQEWRNPQEIQSLWSLYRKKGTKLRLLVTETPINHDVFMGPYDVNYSGGYGDFNYSIQLVQARDLIIQASGASGADGRFPPLSNAPLSGQERPDKPAPRTHTVVQGDTLWGIAQRFLSAGSRYPEIHTINLDVIGPNPNLIFPGQILTLPT